MLAQLIQCCRCEFHTFPGAAAYTQSAAAYTQSAAAYTQGAAAYTQGAAAYMVSAAAYMGKVRIKLTQSSWAGAGTELGNIDLPQQSKTSCRTSLPTPCLVE